MTADSRAPVFRWLDAFWRSGCPSGAGYTVLALWKFADNHEMTARPSRDMLAGMTGTSARSVERHITFAAAYGWIERVERGHRGRATEYRLTFGQRFPSEGAARKRATGDTHSKGATGDTQSGESVPLVTEKGDTGVAPTTHELPKEARRARSTDETQPLPDFIPTEVIQDISHEHELKARGYSMCHGGYHRTENDTARGPEQMPEQLRAIGVTDDTWQLVKEKNLVQSGWAIRKARQAQSGSVDRKAAWFKAAVEQEPARERFERKLFQEI